MNSLRGRLLAFLLSLTLVFSLTVAAVTYRSVLHETDLIFDYQLRAMALSLRDQGAISAEQSAALADPTFDYVVQVWAADGTVTYSSHLSPGLPRTALLGFGTVAIDGRNWRVFGTTARGRVIQVGQPMAVREQMATAAAGRSIMPLLLVAPAVAAAVWWLVGVSLAPLGTLIAAVRSRDAESLAALPAADLPPEIAPLVLALNALLERLRAAFDAQRAFIADAAHELRSPLTAVKLQLEVLNRGTSEAARAAARAELAAGIERLRSLVEQLLTLARAEPGGAELAPDDRDIADIARQAAADVVALADRRAVELELLAAAPVMARVDAAALQILLRNLIDNAVRHSGTGARVRIAVQSLGQEALVAVDDSGPGIPPEERGRVFDRFYRRASAEAGGSGLGLAIVAAIAKRIGARLSLGDAPLGGLRVEVRLPGSG